MQVYEEEHLEPLTIQNVKDEQYSMTSMEWKTHCLDQVLEKAVKMLWVKRSYLEHCINFLQEETIHFRDGKLWISSPNKKNIDQICESKSESDLEFETDYRIYITEKSPKYLIEIAIDFYYCTLYKLKLPGEIAILEETVAYLYSQL